MEKDGEARSAAVNLIARGLITPAEAAELAGVSRQLVHYWLKQHGIMWQDSHRARRATWWRKEIAALNGQVVKPPSKKRLRWKAKVWKERWDKHHARNT